MAWQRVLQQKRRNKNGVDQVFYSYDNYNFTVSIKKIDVVYKPAPEKPNKAPTITVKGKRASGRQVHLSEKHIVNC